MEKKYLESQAVKILDFARDLKKEEVITEQDLINTYKENNLITK